MINVQLKLEAGIKVGELFIDRWQCSKAKFNMIVIFRTHTRPIEKKLPEQKNKNNHIFMFNYSC